MGQISYVVFLRSANCAILNCPFWSKTSLWSRFTAGLAITNVTHTANNTRMQLTSEATPIFNRFLIDATHACDNGNASRSPSYQEAF